MKPDRWFLRALEAIDPALSMKWVLLEGRPTFFLIERRAGRERWLMEIPPNRQDSTMLRVIRGCDTWEPQKLAAYRRECERERDEKYASRGRSYHATSKDMGHAIADSHRVRSFPGLKTPHNDTGHRRGLMREIVRETNPDVDPMIPGV